VVVFHSVFYSEIYQNNNFLKKSFLISAHQNDLKILISSKEKIKKF
jgi:bisphosphoglycerate-dependent phosphoglycerate mutase